jgi:Holliday junction DNA helicase RuvA
MIARIEGKLVEQNDQSVVLNVHGLFYEILVPLSVLKRIEEIKGSSECIQLITYHYMQLSPSSGMPVLVGFLNQIEKDFFQQFIKVSGIGPRAAVKALNKPISEIARAIHEGDVNYLKTLPGIGAQKAKEIVAKLQGKIGRFGLIQDKGFVPSVGAEPAGWRDEALEVLLQLQYKKGEAQEMIDKVLKRSSGIATAEDLLNEIYHQKIHPAR